jgi:hypothetical protein
LEFGSCGFAGGWSLDVLWGLELLPFVAPRGLRRCKDCTKRQIPVRAPGGAKCQHSVSTPVNIASIGRGDFPARGLRQSGRMREIMARLLALQTIQFNAQPQTPAVRAEIEKLRSNIPAPVLGHYDRLVARRKKGVALVRNGVCGSCHLRIIESKLIGLSAATDVHLCDNCGCYLYRPEGETKAPVATPVKRRASKATAHVR